MLSSLSQQVFEVASADSFQLCFAERGMVQIEEHGAHGVAGVERAVQEPLAAE